MAVGWMKRIAAIATLVVAAATAQAQNLSPSDLYESILRLGADADFPPLSGPTVVSHKPHPEARSETWQVTAHLSSATGAVAHLNVSFSRLGLSIDAEDPFDPTALYRAHAVLIRPGGEILADERFSRGLGAAGEDDATVWLDDWLLETGPTGSLRFDLPVAEQRIALHLDTQAAEALILPDTEQAPLRGYAMPSVATAARIDGTEYAGAAWFDHLWGDVPLLGGPVVYDRLVLDLYNGSALSLLRTRRGDGAGIATLDGSLIAPDGGVIPLTDESVELTDEAINGAGLSLSFTDAETYRPDFALPTTIRTFRAEGTLDGAPVSGAGTFLLGEGAE